MSIPSIIFCAPDFQQELHRAFPKTQVYPFASDVEYCRAQIALLDNQDVSRAWLIFQAQDDRSKNEIVTDHINLTATNTLIGPVDLSKGPRFPDMSSIYENDSENGVIVISGDDAKLTDFEESWAYVIGGVWEAIALKHRGYKIQAWLIADLEKWVLNTEYEGMRV